MPLARRGPGLIGTAARTAVFAGTAAAVSGRVSVDSTSAGPKRTLPRTSSSRPSPSSRLRQRLPRRPRSRDT
jgi:hypothetical protein